MLEALKRASAPNEGSNSFEVWLRSSCRHREDVFEQWLLVTAAAFNATPDCACLIFLDQAELLVKEQVSRVDRSQLSPRYSANSRRRWACFWQAR